MAGYTGPDHLRALYARLDAESGRHRIQFPRNSAREAGGLLQEPGSIRHLSGL